MTLIRRLFNLCEDTNHKPSTPASRLGGRIPRTAGFKDKIELILQVAATTQDLTAGGNDPPTDELTHGTKEKPALARSWDNAKQGIRRHVFRAWTACAVLAAYIYSWVYVPELLTNWKRATTAVIEAGCGLLPYPWNDRIEATLGNFGLWVQITLAIILFRVLVWLIMQFVRTAWSGRIREPSAASLHAQTTDKASEG